ncbi:MAG: AAA family ATPase [Thermodesulfobacteriota bacterium]
MKLRKALDKAREARQDGALPAMEDILPAGDLEVPAGEPLGPDASGYLSPVYSESRRVTIDSSLAASHHCVCLDASSCDVEPFKVLRAQILRRTREHGWRTIMVTSALPNEGKTVTTINLAATFAREFSQTVLLVDCDLHKQAVHKYLGIASDRGLIDFLKDQRPLSELIMWPQVDKLTLISGGRTVPDATELLGSPRMHALLAEMKDRYQDRYIFFDVPPLLSGADAMAFAPLVDCVLMVVAAGQTPVEEVQRAVALIPAEKFLGFVLNRHLGPSQRYYAYGRDSRSSAV